MFITKLNRTLHLPFVLQKYTGVKSVTCPANTFADIVDYLTFHYGTGVKRLIAPNEWLIYFDNFEEARESTNVHDLGETKEIYMIPPVVGASNSMKRIIGAVLIIVAIVIAAVSYGAGAQPASYLASMGLSMMLSIGISLIASTLNQIKVPRKTEDNFGFNDAANITEGQGLPAPVVYGRTKVGSVQLATSIEAYRIGTQVSGSGGYTPPNQDNSTVQVAL